jgi:CUB domain
MHQFINFNHASGSISAYLQLFKMAALMCVIGFSRSLNCSTQLFFVIYIIIIYVKQRNDRFVWYWHIDNRVTLTFTHLDIEYTPNCTTDYVQVLNGNNDESPIVGTYCGTTLPLPVVSSGSALVVRFVTDALTQRHGFTASYTTSASGMLS